MNSYQKSGFTLVEISIVMIIIGLLIGGTFSGMKLIENMEAQKTVQDLKSIESAALTFKDTYGRLPGDLTTPAARLPNCTTAPCSTVGDGDRQIDPTGQANSAIDTTMEKFTFWHHLQAANLLSMGYKNVADTVFGEGQPEAAIGGGYRVSSYDGTGIGFCNDVYRAGFLMVTGFDAAATNVQDVGVSCRKIQAVDNKIDDGAPYGGLVIVHFGCESANACSAVYDLTKSNGRLYYNARF